jgi:tRNA A-37 threonylcarbamoyl transferase component Bud32
LALEQAGVATPRVVAVGVHRWIRWPVRAYLIIEYVPDAVTLDHFLGHGWPSKLVYPLADLVARLHAHGFSHRDLKATNVLVDRHHRPWLIDLDGVRDYGRLPDARAVLDLARLAQDLVVRNIPPGRSALRFLGRYCQQREGVYALRNWYRVVTLELERSPVCRRYLDRVRPRGSSTSMDW